MALSLRTKRQIHTPFLFLRYGENHPIIIFNQRSDGSSKCLSPDRAVTSLSNYPLNTVPRSSAEIKPVCRNISCPLLSNMICVGMAAIPKYFSGNGIQIIL